MLEEGEDDDVAAAATFWSSRFDAELNFSGVPLYTTNPSYDNKALSSYYRF